MSIFPTSRFPQIPSTRSYSDGLDEISDGLDRNPSSRVFSPESDPSPGPNGSPSPTRRGQTPKPQEEDPSNESPIPRSGSFDDLSQRMGGEFPIKKRPGNGASIDTLEQDIKKAQGLFSLMRKKVTGTEFIEYVPYTYQGSGNSRAPLQGRKESSVCLNGYRDYFLKKIGLAEREVFSLEETAVRARIESQALSKLQQMNGAAGCFQENAEVSPCHSQRINQIIEELTRWTHIRSSQSSAGAVWDIPDARYPEEREFQKRRSAHFSTPITLPCELMDQINAILSNLEKEIVRKSAFFKFNSSEERMRYLLDQSIQMLDGVYERYKTLINGCNIDVFYLKKHVCNKVSKIIFSVLFQRSIRLTELVSWGKTADLFSYFYLNSLDNSGFKLFPEFKKIINSSPDEIKKNKNNLLFFAGQILNHFDLSELYKISDNELFNFFDGIGVGFTFEEVSSLRRGAVESLLFKIALNKIGENVHEELKSLDDSIEEAEDMIRCSHPALNRDSRLAYEQYVYNKLADPSYYNNVVSHWGLSWEVYTQHDIDVAMTISNVLNQFRVQYGLEEVVSENAQFIRQRVRDGKIAAKIAEMYSTYTQEGNTKEQALLRVWETEEFSQFVCVNSELLAYRILMIASNLSLADDVIHSLHEAANAHQKDKILTSTKAAFDDYIRKQEKSSTRTELYSDKKDECKAFLRSQFMSFPFAKQSMCFADISTESYEAVKAEIWSYILEKASESRIGRGKTSLI
ncbi:MAG: hypothetical protein RLZZ453_303 [Chlamydiota bacterium]|jgi:hypothetical protein